MGSASRLRAGTRPKRHAVLKFPFLAVMLVPGQQRLTVFCVLRPHPVLQVLWQVQVWRSLAPLLSVLLEPESGVFCLVGNVSLPVSCALTAGVDGGFDLEGELQGGHSSLRFWPEDSVQFQNHEMKGDLGTSEQRSRSSLRRLQEDTVQFHDGRFWTAKSFFATSMAGEHCVVP